MKAKPLLSQYEIIVQEAQHDPNIVGLVLTGSRGKGFHSATSDYDPWVIVKNKKLVLAYDRKYDKMDLKNIDLCVVTLADFKKLAQWNENTTYERYDYTHVIIPLDKTGKLTNILAKMGSIPPGNKNAFIAKALDSYINQVYRSVKCRAKKNKFGAHLEAVFSIPHLLDALFAIENRPKPFYGYLEKELKTYPLEYFPWTVDDFIGKIQTILSSGDLHIQQELLKKVEEVFRKEGFNQVFNDWEGKDRWAMTF